MTTSKITIEADVNSDIKKVWDCYLNPKHIVNWNFAIDTWCCPKAENDVRVGGKYMARMEAKDGSFGFDFEAIYDEVDEFKSFTYTMPDGRKVNVSFDTEGNQTKVTVVFDAENENPIEMQKAGWQAILNNFKNYTEGVK